MPLYLSGTLFDAREVRWSRMQEGGGSVDRTLVMKVTAELLSVLPGLRSSKDGWLVDMSRLHRSLANEPWIPRRGTFPADVKTGTLGGYIVTLAFGPPDPSSVRASPPPS